MSKFYSHRDSVRINWKIQHFPHLSKYYVLEIWSSYKCLWFLSYLITKTWTVRGTLSVQTQKLMKLMFQSFVGDGGCASRQAVPAGLPKLYPDWATVHSGLEHSSGAGSPQLLRERSGRAHFHRTQLNNYSTLMYFIV